MLNDISSAASNADFIIYNIPQLAGVSLSVSLYKEMMKNPRVIGVKNFSMPILDIQMYKQLEGSNHVVFNGSDEQLVGGLAIGADGAIGGTYGVMSEVYLAIYKLSKNGEVKKALELQNDADAIIYKMCEAKGNLCAVIKKIITLRDGLEFGGVRRPLKDLYESDMSIVKDAYKMINSAIAKAEKYLY